MYRIGTGIGVVLLGLWLISVGLNYDVGLLIIGIVLAGVGLAILLNKSEDEIEEIHDNNKVS